MGGGGREYFRGCPLVSRGAPSIERDRRISRLAAMNASLLAALASPGAKPVRRPAKPPSAAESKTNTTTAPERGKENMSAAAMGSPRPRAPSFTVPEPPSTPGRMENLRCVGRLADLV